MKAAIVSDDGSVETGLLRAFADHGHEVVLVGTAKSALAARWPASVSSVPDDGAERAAAGADVVIVVDGDVALRPATTTAPARSLSDHAGVAATSARRLVVVATPESDVARAQTDAARAAGVPWIRIETDAVFGAAPSAMDLASAMLALVRSLPVVPVLPSARRRLAPVFAGDLGRLVLAAVTREDGDLLAGGASWGQVLDAGGTEVLSVDELLDHVAALAKRKVRRVPLPRFLRSAGGAFAHVFGVELPDLDEATSCRLDAAATRAQALGAEPGRAFGAFGITLTPLHDALATLAAELPEQRPTAGYGALEHKRFWIDIAGSALGPEALLEVFRRDCASILPIELDVEEGSTGVVERGRTLTAALPLRGHIQMRVQETEPRHITFATVEGHPIAGVVRFSCLRADPTTLRFEVEVFARSGTPFDFVALKAGGAAAQNLTWSTVCERMAERSGGHGAAGVVHEIESLAEGDAHEIEAWIERLISRRERHEHEDDAAQRNA